jgi:hypothetical protein
MIADQLKNIQNENGGGLSFEVTGKQTSVRHALAKEAGKLTAGEVGKHLSKSLKIKVLAKEVVSAYRILKNKEPEWHHAGFYKQSGKKSTMGRTFFFTNEDVDFLIQNWNKLEGIKQDKEKEINAKKQNIIQGFYYYWDNGYSRHSGKKINYKVLKSYEGNELDKPRNFTQCSKEEFENVKTKEGKYYFGWDEPLLSEFKTS